MGAHRDDVSSSPGQLKTLKRVILFLITHLIAGAIVIYVSFLIGAYAFGLFPSNLILYLIKLIILVIIGSGIVGHLCLLFMYWFWDKPLPRNWRATLLGGFFVFVGAFGMTTAVYLICGVPVSFYHGFVRNPLLWIPFAVTIGVIAHYFIENSISFFKT